MKNNFDTVCIIGLGLIGGSIGLSMKKNNFESKLLVMQKQRKLFLRQLKEVSLMMLKKA
jgi:prephenate dehydrogenase